MLRTRRITSPAFPIAGVKVCDECQRPKKIKRNHAGRSYCDACYQREFPHMPCAACGEDCRAKRGTVVPYCRRCEAERRLCKGCGRPAPRAGMYHEGEVVCPSCVPKYKPKEPCPACGEPSSRLSRIGGEGDAICDHCRNGHDHATCGTCGRYRRQADQIAGKPICVECVEGITHICPDCVKDVPGGGESRCRECAARARGRAQVEACCETLHQTWVQDLFRRHCEADLLSAPRGDVVRRIEKAAAFFATMDSTMDSAAAVTSDSLLEAYGPEGLRRASKAVLFIIGSLHIAWPMDATEAFAEKGRIQSMLEAIIDRPWAGDIAAFVDFLRSPDRAKRLRLKSLRMYLRSAIALMERSDRQSANEIDDGDVAAFLRRSRGHANSLRAFTGWIGGVSMPTAPERRDPKSHETRTLREGRAIAAALQTQKTRGKALALLAAGIAKLHGVPLSKILRLRAHQIAKDGATLLILDDMTIKLAQPLATAMTRWNVATNDDLLFKSLRTGKAMSTSGVLHHVRSLVKPPGKN